MFTKVTETVQAKTNRLCVYVVSVTLVFGLSGAINHTRAEIVNSDYWHGGDKALHFMGSMPFGMLGASVFSDAQTPTERFFYGTLLGSLPGLAKEIHDIRQPSADASYKDMTFNILGAAVGAALVILIDPAKNISHPQWTIAPLGTKNQVNGVVFQYRADF